MKESTESTAARAPLAKAYDTARGVVMVRVPHAYLGPAASGISTPDDLLH